jgi:group II intron reverse transcriptase/maturase
LENPTPEDASLASVQGSIGVDQDRGMCEEKRTDDHPEEDGTLNSGSPNSTLLETIWLQQMNDFQRNEEVAKEARDSDSPIVVRDGNTDHTAKGRAERQSGQSTHARERNTPERSVSRTLSALRAKAEQEPEHRFRGLSRLLDKQMLREAFACLKCKAAPGIDGVTHAEYAQNLEVHLTELEKRLKAGRYRASSVKRRWIAKAGSNKMRPLGIPVLEDKIVQQAVKMILESIWEADFYDESIGYRQGVGARESSKDLAEALNDGTYRWVVEADIRGFFDHIDHGWMVRMLEERIADRPLIRLIVKWLKAGVMETDGSVVHPATGTPQGGVISPILANIYLHFVQDQWIKKVVSKRSKGKVLFRRYADDSVVCFERLDDAQAYLRELPKRLEKFNLQIAEEKSSLVKFNRWEPDQSGKFTFLGFDFYWGRSRKYPQFVNVRRRTNRKKFQASLLALKEWMKKARSLRLPDLLTVLRRKLRGYWNYYGVRGNSKMLGKYQYEVYLLLYKWLNRRSQRRSMTQKNYSERWKTWDMPTARIVEEYPKKTLHQTTKPA